MERCGKEDMDLMEFDKGEWGEVDFRCDFYVTGGVGRNGRGNGMYANFFK